jgi:hypothetical protein
MANIASLRNEVEQHHFERSEKHHIAVGDASLRYTRLCLDVSLVLCSNPFEQALMCNYIKNIGP